MLCLAKGANLALSVGQGKTCSHRQAFYPLLREAVQWLTKEPISPGTTPWKRSGGGLGSWSLCVTVASRACLVSDVDVLGSMDVGLILVSCFSCLAICHGASNFLGWMDDRSPCLFGCSPWSFLR